MPSFSKACTAFTANGVEAPAPSRSHARFIAAASHASSLRVLNAFRHSGRISFAASRVMPHFSATEVSPIHTAYTQNKVSAAARAARTPPVIAGKNCCGASAHSTAAEHMNMAVKTAFIK